MFSAHKVYLRSKRFGKEKDIAKHFDISGDTGFGRSDNKHHRQSYASKEL
jgi:hypothetical protein